MQTIGIIAVFAAGYVASIWTWQPIHTWWIGLPAKIDALKAKAEQLETKFKEPIK